MSLLFKFSIDHVREDLKGAVGVCPKSGSWLNTIFVDHSEGTELIMCCTHISKSNSSGGPLYGAKVSCSRCEGESVEGLQPTMVGMTALVNKQPYVPGQIGASGLFESNGVSTLTVTIEEKHGDLALVEPSPRGGPASALGRGAPVRSKRALRYQSKDQKRPVSPART